MALCEYFVEIIPEEILVTAATIEEARAKARAANSGRLMRSPNAPVAASP